MGVCLLKLNYIRCCDIFFEGSCAIYRAFSGSFNTFYRLVQIEFSSPHWPYWGSDDFLIQGATPFFWACCAIHTVDGRNPAPVDMVNIAFFHGFRNVRWCAISSINSSSPKPSKIAPCTWERCNRFEKKPTWSDGGNRHREKPRGPEH